MSLPIKIVEDSNQSPDKNISIYQSNQANENQNLQNYSFHQSYQINNLFPSLTLNISPNIPIQSNISLNNNENSHKIKEGKKQGFESFNIINESNNKKSNENENYFNNISNEETIGQKILDQPEARPCFYPLEIVDKKNDIKDMDIENINSHNSNQFINKNIISQNFNNCPNENNKKKTNEIKEHFQILKDYSDKMVTILKSISEKNEYWLKSSQDIKSNNSQIDTENKLKINKKLKKDLIININVNVINSNGTDLKEDEEHISTSKIKSNFAEKENIIKPILNINKSKNMLKNKKHEIKDENNLNKNNISHICKVKNFKRINNRNFNIKSRGLRYNILTEEKKKQLLLDAMNMRTIEVAKKYGISTRNVNRWKKKRNSEKKRKWEEI